MKQNNSFCVSLLPVVLSTQVAGGDGLCAVGLFVPWLRSAVVDFNNELRMRFDAFIQKEHEMGHQRV